MLPTLSEASHCCPLQQASQHWLPAFRGYWLDTIVPSLLPRHLPSYRARRERRRSAVNDPADP